ncbi:hypothetical protein [Lysinibacillus xylanilyticus]|uniref:hypothetical protein n=1 Tax=Lysinibacillus xylanilyticus TaxID=582475 RepID=UPI001586F22C|nr:hypothetical protein [Lysinibacillus xylanilyticus]
MSKVVNDICYINAIYRLLGAEAKRLIGRPQEALLCAKAKRQLTKRPAGTEINHTLW